MIVALDTGPLGLVTHPLGGADAAACRNWLTGLLHAGHTVVIPEIADYELRRELIRAGLTDSIDRLEALELALGYQPITTAAMRRACGFWAQLRNSGLPTAPDPALDGDMILAAQVTLIDHGTGESVVLATANVGHLGRVCDARDWRVGAW